MGYAGYGAHQIVYFLSTSTKTSQKKGHRAEHRDDPPPHPSSPNETREPAQDLGAQSTYTNKARIPRPEGVGLVRLGHFPVGPT